VIWRWPFTGSDQIKDFAVRDDGGSMLLGPVSGSRRYDMAAFSRQISRLMLSRISHMGAVFTHSEARLVS